MSDERRNRPAEEPSPEAVAPEEAGSVHPHEATDSLEELQEKLKGRPFAVLTVNMEESDAKVGRFLQSALLQKDSLTVLYDRFGNATKAWKARLLPVSFLVGTDGRIHSTLLGAAHWTSPEGIAQIEKLLPQGGTRSPR